MLRLLPLGVAGALLLPAVAPAAGLPDFDVRDGVRAVVTVARPGPARLGRALTRPLDAPARRVARGYLAEHVPAADLATLGAPQVIRAPGGLRTVRFAGDVGGIPSFDSAVTVGVDRRGRVVSVAGRPERLAIATTKPRVSAAAAMAAFARSTLQRAGARTEVRPGPRHETRFGNDFARLVVFAGAGRDRLAWHVSLGDYDGVVDAATGAVLRRHYLVRTAAAAAVFPNYPGARAGGAQVPVDLEALGWLGPEAANLSGPYVHAYADTLSNDSPGIDGEVPRTADGDFVYPFTSFGVTPPRCAEFAACGWNSSQRSSWQTNLRQTTVQTFFLDGLFYEHLKAGPIGFDEASGNFAGADPVLAETDDGAATLPPSPLPLISPENLNNADMATPADGSSPRMQMYLGAYDDLTVFGRFRDYNNGDDAATVFHEYTHGLTSRLVTHADGSEALDGAQAAAMGEAWGDWYAFDYLVRNQLSPDTTAGGEVDIGIYSDVSPHATRTQGLDCSLQSGGAAAEPCPGTAGAGPGGYTYGDFGKIDPNGPEIHADGEIWGETLWDLRTAFVASEHGQDAGSDLAEALVTGGLRLAPPEPSFLNMRDAILQADVALFGGAHLATLWTVFAARGMGVDATSSSGDDTAPHEGFKVPEAAPLTGTLNANPARIDPGGRVEFTAAFPPGTGAEGYAWDFDGDGRTDATTHVPQTSHVYASSGSYLARVKVTDTRLASGTATAKITVTGGGVTPGPGPGSPDTPSDPAPGQGNDTDSAQLRVVGTGRHGRYTVRVRCRPSCVVRLDAHLTRATARRIGLSNRRVRSLTRTVRGTGRVRVHVGRRLRREARARGVALLRVLVEASARPPSGAAAHRRRTVRVRV